MSTLGHPQIAKHGWKDLKHMTLHALNGAKQPAHMSAHSFGQHSLKQFPVRQPLQSGFTQNLLSA